MNGEMPTTYPDWFEHDKNFDPQDATMQLKGRDYLNVEARVRWFVRDQRALIAARLAKVPYVVEPTAVEFDQENGYALFKCFVRDVLGNESTGYGSETRKDFADFAEKASTKSLGRALIALGYNTGAAQDLDEGERVVDAPVTHRNQTGNQNTQRTQSARATTPTNTANATASKPTTPPSQQAGLETQQDLYLGIKDLGFQFVNDAQAWLDQQIGRNDVDVQLLKTGTSTLTQDEAQTLQKVLALRTDEKVASLQGAQYASGGVH